MATVIEKWSQRKGQPIFLCDFSPARGATQDYLEQADLLAADFICVAYSPGKSVRVASAITAYVIKREAGKDVIFNLSTRDMNRLALQSYLLGAQALGLENVVVLKGDEFTEREKAQVKNVGDFKPVELIGAIKSMNQGLDYRGLRLRAPTSFCIGASIDLSKGIEREARLVHRKVSAGADFFIAQPVHDPQAAREFLEAYGSVAGQELSPPVFYGIQIPSRDSVVLLGETTEAIRRDLDMGRDGSDIALEELHNFVDRGITTIYLIPPILRGGRRGYEAARRVLDAFKG